MIHRNAGGCCRFPVKTQITPPKPRHLQFTGLESVTRPTDLHHGLSRLKADENVDDVKAVAADTLEEDAAGQRT